MGMRTVSELEVGSAPQYKVMSFSRTLLTDRALWLYTRCFANQLCALDISYCKHYTEKVR